MITNLRNPSIESDHPFPFDIFPDNLGIFAKRVADSVNCNQEFVAAAMLSAFSIAIGSRVKLEIKKGWQEGGVIFLVIVGEPGSKKTPAISKGIYPITLLQIKSGVKKSLQDTPTIVEDGKLVETIITTDATLESLAELLSKNEHGILLLMDEAVALWKGFNQYKKGGNDLEKFLSFWSQILIIITRKKAPNIQINNPFVTFLGGMTVDLLDSLAAMRGNGFMDRLLFSYPKAIPSKHTEVDIPDEMMGEYVRSVHAIFHTEIDEDNNIIRFTPQAQVLWTEWHTEYCEEMNKADVPYYLKGALSKLEAYTARFALILEFVRCSATEQSIGAVSFQSLTGAIELTRYFKAQVAKVHSSFTESAQEKQIEKAVAWLMKQPSGMATMRKVYTNRVAGMKNASEAYDLLGEMKSRGLGRLEEYSEGAKRMYRFYLHPKLLPNPS